MRDFSKKDNKATLGPFWVMGNFENNLQLKEYANMRSLIRKKSAKNYQLPYEWAGLIFELVFFYSLLQS